jgi:endonuclease/exonuclease/phosphatase family metal-dependent hydrolase
MMRCLRRFAVTILCTVLLVSGFQVAAEASGVARVSGVSVTGQDWCNAKIRLRWKRVSGATYQVRWASAKARLRGAVPVSVRKRTVSAGPVSMSGTSYFQVRAVRHGRAGAWSKVRTARFTSHWPGEPHLSGYGVPGGATVTWGCALYASRYRVMWGAAPFGKWPSTPSYISGWLPGTARSSTFTVPSVPQPGDYMLGVAYANPVWGRLEAGNPNGGVRLSTGWVPVFPTPPDPGTGDRMRIGSYNVMLAPTGGTRIQAIAANIASHGLDVVALQEATATTAAALVGSLGAGWDYVRYANSPEQILYRTTAYRVGGSDLFDVPNAKTPGTPLKTPWAKLVPVNGTAKSQPVYVVSAHVTENDAKSAMEHKADAGRQAQAMMAGVDAANTAGSPVIIAGDLHYLREPWGDVPGYVEAPPTLVRGGYYDAMAALGKTNIAYSTFNGGNGTTAPRQDPVQSGVSGRADYIMLKGFRGSNAYTTVANWTWGGITPSDHNLVYADVTVPYAP